ncbi:hypothetical protein M0R04_13375 [Candidatus Dojkabacteria bacterium]|jgi:hypothetical protein|nr:hypothetical protein [Candidatus Dojkabacteria bacterium]
MKLTDLKTKYKSYKNILTVLESGDIKDERYKLLIRTLKVQDVEAMQKFVKELENYGVQYLYEKN